MGIQKMQNILDDIETPRLNRYIEINGNPTSDQIKIIRTQIAKWYLAYTTIFQIESTYYYIEHRHRPCTTQDILHALSEFHKTGIYTVPCGSAPYKPLITLKINYLTPSK